MTIKISPLKPEYLFLSIYWPATSIYGCTGFTSLAHGYEAARCNSGESSSYIRNIKEARDVIPLCRIFPDRKDWQNVRRNLLLDLLRQKFFVHEDLGRLLLSTGNAQIIDNTLDRYLNENLLGKALEEIRQELRGFVQKISDLLKKHKGKRKIALSEMQKNGESTGYGGYHLLFVIFDRTIRGHGLK